MRHCALFLTLALGAAAPAMAFQASDAATLQAVQAYTEGEQALKDGNLDKAITSFETAANLNPELVLAHFFIGSAYLQKKDFPKAVENFNAFLKAAKGNAGLAQQVAVAEAELRAIPEIQQKKYEDAIAILKAETAAVPTDKDAFINLAKVLFQTKDMAGAEAAYLKVMQLDPSDPLPFYFTGTMAYQRQDDADATKRLEAFVALDSKSSSAGRAYFMLGTIAKRANNLDKAMEYYEKYLALDPPAGATTDAVKQLVESYKAHEAAVEAAEKAKEAAPAQ
jgi:tetratricopeptide (TPR) repeat protein